MKKVDKIIETMATRLSLEPALLKAVVAVETNGEPFLPDGRPTILFEGHIFWKLLKEKGVKPAVLLEKDASLSRVLYPQWTTRHYAGGVKEYDRLDQALRVDKDAALASASWGLFQIMGFNWNLCNVKNITSFVEAQKTIEGQAETASSFLVSKGLVDVLRRHEWATFAKRYNGASYAAHAYDLKLEQAFKRYSHG